MRNKIIIIITCLFIPLLVLSFLSGCNTLKNQTANSSGEEKLGGFKGLYISQDDNSAYSLQENGMYQSGTFDKETGIFTVAWECIYTVKGSDVKLYDVPEDSQNASDLIEVGGAKIINGKIETVSGYTAYNKSYTTDRSKVKEKFDLRKLGILFADAQPSIENNADGEGYFEGTWTRSTKDVSFEMKTLFDMDGKPTKGEYHVWMPYNIFDENDPKYYDLGGNYEAKVSSLIIYDGSSSTACPRNGYTFYIPADNVFGDPMFEGTYFPAGKCKFYPKEKEELAAETTQEETAQTTAKTSAEEIAKNPIEKLLIGKWAYENTDQGLYAEYEFMKDGTFKVKAEDKVTGNTQNTSGTYAVNGDQVNLIADNRSTTWTVNNITNDTLSFSVGGNTGTLNRVK